MRSKRNMLILLINAFWITPTLPAMASLRNRAASSGNALKRAAVARFSTVKPSITSASSLKTQIPKPVLARQFSSSRDDEKGRYQRWWQQEGVKDAIKIALGITASAAIGAIIGQATEIADFAQKTFFMGTLDEGLISDEFSRAIVKIYDERGGQCSGCIIASEKYPGVYFVLTAAHCVSAEGNDYVNIKHPHYSDDSDKDIKIGLTQVLLEPRADIAVLLIPTQEIRKFQAETGTSLPAIPATQLARIEPRKNEVVLLQGYPGRVLYKNFYREKFMTGGPTTVYKEGGEREETLTKLIPLEKHSPEALHGASGAPYIVIRDSSPEVQGVHSAGEFYQRSKLRAGPTYGGGFGKLPHYLQKAEKNASDLREEEKRARELQEAEQRARDLQEKEKRARDLREAAQNKPWYRRLFGF